MTRRLTHNISWLATVFFTAWRWFGPATALHILRLLPTLVDRPFGMQNVYERVGETAFRLPYRGKVVRWHYADVGFVWEIFDQECYTRLPTMAIGEEDTVVDAGANVGVFTVLAALCASRGRVVAMEPNCTHYQRLSRNVEANHFENVTLVNAALTPDDGMVTLWHDSRGSGSDSLERREASHGDQVLGLSPLTVFAKCGLEGIDLLKMDIEGTEFRLLSGDLSWLRHVKRVAIEAHARYGDPVGVLRRLEKAGFQVTCTKVGRSLDPDLVVYAHKTEE